MGPTGVLLVKKECMPTGLRSVRGFDMGELDGEDAEDELVKQLRGQSSSRAANFSSS